MIGKKLHKDRDELLTFCSKWSNIYIYGNGYVAERILSYLYEEEIKCAGIIVSEGRRVEDYFCGIKIYECSEISITDVDGIIVAMSIANANELMHSIKCSKSNINLENIYVQKIYTSDSWKFRNISILLDHNRKSNYFDNKLLDSLGKKYGTDKNSEENNYCSYYEFFLSKYKDTKMNILELGIYKGSSLAMWEEYFPNATVYGVDINERCKVYEEGRKKVLIKDLSKEEELVKLSELQPQIIIDDASHLWSHQIKALYQLLPRMPKGGIYILEDLATSFVTLGDTYDDACVSAYDFLNAVLEVVTSGTKLRTEGLSYALGTMKEEIENIANYIEMMSFVMGSCIIVKK